ncbi:enoyl-CoA hydratase-related protein [Gordonia sp. LSe1-13]|uniref:Enoyl-CoA hydratase-related protein n=1 Tax=Gordonia sesuvii TaxID=3116777 RepID=A0ABU7MGV1_9ACTN|nr:enoyl-CoA hydratase-related protein [Gordonia sp. LSe1-13]
MSDNEAVVDEVRVEVDARGVARIEIDRQHRMNALNGKASATIMDALGEWSQRDDVRVVVIDGVGGSFSTGADVIDIAQAAGGNPTGGLDATQARGVISSGSDLARAVRSVRAPVIAAVDGPAVGIGASLAFASDLVFATERSYFLLAFINIGLMPDGGASMSVAASVGRARANAMALLGEKLPAAEAFGAGLLSGLVADRAALDAKVDKAVGKLVGTSASALRLTKAALDAHTMGDFEAALDRELDGQTELLQSAEFQAAMAAFAGSSKS